MFKEKKKGQGRAILAECRCLLVVVLVKKDYKAQTCASSFFGFGLRRCFLVLLLLYCCLTYLPGCCDEAPPFVLFTLPFTSVDSQQGSAVCKVDESNARLYLFRR